MLDTSATNASFAVHMWVKLPLIVIDSERFAPSHLAWCLEESERRWHHSVKRWHDIKKHCWKLFLPHGCMARHCQSHSKARASEIKKANAFVREQPWSWAEGGVQQKRSKENDALGNWMEYSWQLFGAGRMIKIRDAQRERQGDRGKEQGYKVSWIIFVSYKY